MEEKLIANWDCDIGIRRRMKNLLQEWKEVIHDKSFYQNERL